LNSHLKLRIVLYDLLQVLLPHLFSQLSLPVLILECVGIKPVESACPQCDIVSSPCLIPSLASEVDVICSVHELPELLMRLLELFYIGPLDSL